MTADYTYDGLERLAIRTTQNMTPSGTTHYVYDRAGHLVAEATDSGTTVREYIWLDDMPLAVVADVDTTSPQLYTVHADHLNRPIMMTDTSKATVWEAHYWPFGDAYSITGSAANNLRFPGQYFLIESGLAYNWHRHYDPTIGRYTQPDPLGFVGGPSIYAYARSAPTMNVDPDGRNPAAVIVGAAWLCSRYPALCRATAKAAVDACIATYKILVEGGGRKGKNYCKKVRAKCIDYCSDVALPTGDDGFEFFNCVNICLEKHGCPSVRG